MKTDTIAKTKSNYQLEQRANASLASMPPDARPEMADRGQAVNVAYSARGMYEVTSTHGGRHYVCAAEVARWANGQG